MKFKFLLSVVLCSWINLFTSCKPAAKNEVKLSEAQDSTTKTANISATDTQGVDTSAIVDKAINMSSDLISYVDETRKEFDGLVSPFEAKYLGFDMGDYPHIIFKAKNGKVYDFGNGANKYGSFKEEDFLAEKSKYEGKTFKITWEWKTSTFYCCEGEMNLMSAMVPSIVSLELVK